MTEITAESALAEHLWAVRGAREAQKAPAAKPTAAGSAVTKRAAPEGMELNALFSMEASGWLADKLSFGMHVGGVEFELAEEEDYTGYGFDPVSDILVQRKSDGRFFEVEVEVSLHTVSVAAKKAS